MNMEKKVQINKESFEEIINKQDKRYALSACQNVGGITDSEIRLAIYLQMAEVESESHLYNPKPITERVEDIFDYIKNGLNK